MARELGELDADGVPATSRSDRVLMLIAILARLFASVQVATWLILTARSSEPRAAALTVGYAAAGHALITLDVFRRKHGVTPRWALADAAFSAALLLFGALAADVGAADPWRFAFPYTVSSALVVSLAAQPWRNALMIQAIPTTAYVVAAVSWRPEGGWNIAQDLVTYAGALLATRAVADELRRSGRHLDNERRDSLARQAELAATQERTRFLRDLHDHELQTLETLARGRFIPDQRMRTLVYDHAVRLRGLVEGNAESESTGRPRLEHALAQVSAQHLALGLQVDLRTQQLHQQTTPAVATAVAAAVHEALTNVRKHAGVDRATVWAGSTDETVIVAVSDRGCGFDPRTSRRGVGVRDSICARMREVGGSAVVASARDAGTRVEVRAPVAGSREEAGR